MLGRSRAVRPPLRKAKLDQHLRPRRRIGLLVEHACEISTATSAAPWASERSAAWRSVETTNESARGATRRRCRTLRRRAGLEQQFSGRAVRGVSFDHIERLVDSAADDRVEELERIFATEEVKPTECGGCRTRSPASTPARAAAWRSSVRRRGRGRAEQAERLRRQRARRSRTTRETPSAPISSNRARARRSGWFPPVQPRPAPHRRRADCRRSPSRGRRRRLRPARDRAARAARRSKHAQAVRGESRRPPNRRRVLRRVWDRASLPRATGLRRRRGEHSSSLRVR